MDESPVLVDAVERRFGRRVALDGVSLEVARGEVFALAGANGSGKTTLLKLLAGFLGPDAGRVRVFGLDPLDGRTATRARFAFAPPALYDELTAVEHLRLVGGLGAAERPSRAAVDEVLALVGLAERALDRVGGYSFGMRQRLALALALVPRPELLVLDEPTDGLDPLGVLELRDLLRDLRDATGVTILLAQHQFAELAPIVDRVAVLDRGRVLLEGDPRALSAAEARLRVETDDPAALAAALRTAGHAAQVRGAFVELAPDALTAAEVLAVAGRVGCELRSFACVEPGFEELLVRRLRSARGERIESGAPTTSPTEP